MNNLEITIVFDLSDKNLDIYSIVKKNRINLEIYTDNKVFRLNFLKFSTAELQLLIKKLRNKKVKTLLQLEN
ncbi:hypothetical protein CHRYSEO8AT_440012 [Chryseobacterium sp. 8AT]|nr:hypothetical protein CHRYSEO8AT_440012 [Chryseobacterium sp. 8AT]